MKTKKRFFLGVLLFSLLVSLVWFGFGINNLKRVYAQEVINTEAPASDTGTNEPELVENFNTTIKAWTDTLIGGAGVLFDALLLALISKKKEQSVAVTVNDSDTQEKLSNLSAEYATLKKLLVDMFQLTKGTLEVLTTLYADNKSLDLNARNTIKSISMNSEDIIKDVNDILNADTHKAVKTVLHNISNIVLG